jgi:NADH-quinone oxidoreductase subunit C/D
MNSNLTNIENIHSVENRYGVCFLQCDVKDLSQVMIYLFEHLELRYLVEAFAVDSMGQEGIKRFQVNYLLKNLETYQLYCVQVQVNDGEEIESQSPIWKNAYIHELEMQEMMGISYKFNPRPLFLQASKFGHPLRKDFNGFKEVASSSVNREEWLQIHPQHLIKQNEIEIFLNLDDDKVIDCQLESGFTHFGLEKKCETCNVDQILNLSDKCNSFVSPFHNVLWADTIEKLLNINLPDRAMAIRMILVELSRMMDHFHGIALIAHELKFQKYYLDMLFYIKRVRELIRYYCGADAATTFTCIGGVRYDIPQGWISLCMDVLDLIEDDMMDFNKVVSKSSIWKNTLKTGHISAQEAMKWGLGGVNLRASGINYDIRKHQPYYFYNEIDFDVPIGQGGEVLDRYLVRLEEIFQSIKIIVQVLDNMPTGEIISDEAKTFRNLKQYGQIIDEQAYRDFVEKSVDIPADSLYNSMESGSGEIGIYLKGDGSPVPNRMKIFSSHSNALAAFPEIARGNHYEDILLIYASLNMHMSEVER